MFSGLSRLQTRYCRTNATRRTDVTPNRRIFRCVSKRIRQTEKWLTGVKVVYLRYVSIYCTASRF